MILLISTCSKTLNSRYNLNNLSLELLCSSNSHFYFSGRQLYQPKVIVMSKSHVVFGVTGGPIISYASNEMPNMYKIRAVTRGISKPESHIFIQEGINVLNADLNDDESIRQEVLKGSRTIFSMTTGYYNGSSSSGF
ncbi:unnamed protein product [Debaryomyces fabryi]|nr:unnamed protein product [Debaryomyces fabryi]